MTTMKSITFLLAVVGCVNCFTVNSPSTTQRTGTSLNSFSFPDFGSFFNGGGDSSPSTKTTVIAGASGYIGKSVVRESVRQGYNTIALVRDLKKVESPEGKAKYEKFFEGATLVECDVCDEESLTKVCSLRKYN